MPMHRANPDPADQPGPLRKILPGTSFRPENDADKKNNRWPVLGATAFIVGVDPEKGDVGLTKTTTHQESK
jgi:hypothetical protein